MHTGRTPSPVLTYPSLGSVVAFQGPRLPGYQETSLPTYISVGGGRGAEGPGFLGMNYAPFTVQNPGTPPENIRPPSNELANEPRIQRRRRLFWEMEDSFTASRAPHLTGQERNRFADASRSHGEIYLKGFSLVASREGQVFDLRNEPPRLQEEYGNDNFGRAALLARRLVESGVSAVEISMGGWDTHNQNFNALRTTQLPRLDRAMGTLIRDLNDRGMLRNTVILWMGEFGRTPRINQNSGRDHWSRCWSVVVGGGAIRGGQAYGTTDAQGLNVDQNPVRVQDLFATVYRALGINHDTQVRDAIGRPFSISGEGGRPIQALL
jgi:hypothetical protein